MDGQYERWNCLQAAERHGFALLGRQPFYPPPASSTSYEFRRHQTGKAFGSARPGCGSETFTYTVISPSEKGGRQPTTTSPSEIAKALFLFLFPWLKQDNGQAPACKDAVGACAPALLSNLLVCPYCDKTFQEERSRTSHIRAKHPNGVDKKRRQEELEEFSCSDCDKSFGSSSALQDHIRSKHSALHKSVPPDWHQTNNTEEQDAQVGKKNAPPGMEGATANNDAQYGSCDVCGLVYYDEAHQQSHMKEFDPTSQEIRTYECTFCSKSFREKRARLQHENFCSKRQQQHPPPSSG